jgi:hypothetical protein
MTRRHAAGVEAGLTGNCRTDSAGYQGGFATGAIARSGARLVQERARRWLIFLLFLLLSASAGFSQGRHAEHGEANAKRGDQGLAARASTGRGAIGAHHTRQGIEVVGVHGASPEQRCATAEAQRQDGIVAIAIVS